MYQSVLLILWSFFLSKFKIPKFISACSYIMHMFIRDFECLKLSHINHQKENHGSTIHPFCSPIK